MGPLLQPEECCIVFVDPKRTHIAQSALGDQESLIQRFKVIENAASATAVPTHFIIEGTTLDIGQWLAIPSQAAKPRVHNFGTSGSSWSRSGLAPALTAEKRSSLIICGFWLETSVTFVALHALAAGFDVSLVMDATPSYTKEAREHSSNRLLQAGAVPMTTHQLVAEWAEQTTDLALRAKLSLLVQLGHAAPITLTAS